MKPRFKDHFSSNSKAYKAHRPTYPAELFGFLAAEAPARRCAWDCGTGNGQAAVALASHFERVIATDASTAQLAEATPHERVEYLATPAEQTPLESNSIHLITVAQALHWFDIGSFFEEVDRLLVPGGVLGVWSYNFARVEPAIDAIIDDFASNKVGPYWPPERALVDKDYSDIGFPFNKVEAPEFEMGAEWEASDMLAYLTTWSAVKRFRDAERRDPVSDIEASLRSAWKSSKRRVSWPMAIFVRRK